MQVNAQTATKVNARVARLAAGVSASVKSLARAAVGVSRTLRRAVRREGGNKFNFAPAGSAVASPTFREHIAARASERSFFPDIVPVAAASKKKMAGTRAKNGPTMTLEEHFHNKWCGVEDAEPIQITPKMVVEIKARAGEEVVVFTDDDSYFLVGARELALDLGTSVNGHRRVSMLADPTRIGYVHRRRLIRARAQGRVFADVEVLRTLYPHPATTSLGLEDYDAVCALLLAVDTCESVSSGSSISTTEEREDDEEMPMGSFAETTVDEDDDEDDEEEEEKAPMRALPPTTPFNPWVEEVTRDYWMPAVVVKDWQQSSDDPACPTRPAPRGTYVWVATEVGTATEEEMNDGNEERRKADFCICVEMGRAERFYLPVENLIPLIPGREEEVLASLEAEDDE